MKTALARYQRQLARMLGHRFDAEALAAQDANDVFNHYGFDLRAPYQIVFVRDAIDPMPHIVPLNAAFFMGHTFHETALDGVLARHLRGVDDKLTLWFEAPALVPKITTPDDMATNRHILTHERRLQIVLCKHDKNMGDVFDYTVDCLRAVHDNAHDLMVDVMDMRNKAPTRNTISPTY